MYIRQNVGYSKNTDITSIRVIYVQTTRWKQYGFVICICWVENCWGNNICLNKNITSRADVFPFPRSFLDHLNRRTKIELRCRCFVNFFCGDAVLVIFFCGVAVLTVPQCPPHLEIIGTFVFIRHFELSSSAYSAGQWERGLWGQEQWTKRSVLPVWPFRSFGWSLTQEEVAW